METVLSAAITGAVSLVVCLITNHAQNKRTLALLDYRLGQLEQKVSKHNNLVERTYHLEGDMEETMDWKTMQTHFDEEIADAMKYKSLAEKAEGGGRQMLMDMAREECTHAKHICQMMHEHGEGKAENREQLKRLREKLNSV